MDFLNNGWVVGIATGIIVYIITTVLVKMFSKGERIKRANNDIINRLRGYILNEGVPADAIFEAIRNSVGFEHKVNPELLLTKHILCERMIAEIMGNAYLSTVDQKKNILFLVKYLETRKDQAFIKEDDYDGILEKSRREESILKALSIIIGGVATLVMLLALT